MKISINLTAEASAPSAFKKGNYVAHENRDGLQEIGVVESVKNGQIVFKSLRNRMTFTEESASKFLSILDLKGIKKAEINVLMKQLFTPADLKKAIKPGALRIASSAVSKLSHQGVQKGTVVFNNNAEGAAACLIYEAKFDGYVVKATADPYSSGVWKLTTDKGENFVVYLAGHKDAAGNVRPYNDFEEVG